MGLFAVWFHFFRTRSCGYLPWQWSPRGFVLGLAAVLAIMVANAASVLTLAWAVGLPMEE